MPQMGGCLRPGSQYQHSHKLHLSTRRLVVKAQVRKFVPVDQSSPIQGHSPFKLTPGQKEYVQVLREHEKKVVIVTGPAGSGKTKLASELGMEMLRQGKYERVILTRPMVPAGGEQMGYLPGNMVAKMQPWITPIADAVSDSPFSMSIFAQLRDAANNPAPGLGIPGNGSGASSSISSIEVVPLCYMRGRTFLNSWIICDEAQNCSEDQLLMLLTRLGNNSKMVILADPQQTDLVEQKKDVPIIKLANAIDRDIVDSESKLKNHVVHVKLTIDDIKRNPLIVPLLNMFPLS